MQEKEAHRTPKPHSHGKGKKRKFSVDRAKALHKKHARLFETLKKW